MYSLLFPYFFLTYIITPKQTRRMSHCGLAIYIKKYLKEKKNYENSNIETMQKYNLQKHPLGKTKILQES